MANCENSDEMWIFGYGSLIWKADFPFVEKQTGCIRGFTRRFYQHSIDHRGTHSNPGRVVTIIPSTDENSEVWGMAYRIDDSEKQNVIKHLDYREKNGYTRQLVQFHPYSSEAKEYSKPKDIFIYVALNENESFAGESNLQSIAEQVFQAVGPSGTNKEYVYKLADAMRLFYPGILDDHLFKLEEYLKEMEVY